VALFSTEVKYIVLFDCSCQCIWIHFLLNELGYNFGTIHVNSDNQGLIFMAKNPVTESQNKHIDMHFYAICNFIAQEKVKLFYIEESENPVNMFTKNFNQVKFTKFRSQLGLVSN